MHQDAAAHGGGEGSCELETPDGPRGCDLTSAGRLTSTEANVTTIIGFFRGLVLECLRIQSSPPLQHTDFDTFELVTPGHRASKS
jgi:hypothetical protein